MKSCKTFFSLLAVGVLFAGSAVAQKGNGLPKNQKLLFNLEVIAYDGANCPQGSLDGGGHRIAVKADVNDTEFGEPDNHPGGTLVNQLVRENDIMLRPGPFAVLDGNACVDGVASFQLPTNPFSCSAEDPECLDSDPVFQEYEVYARLVGKPGTGVDVRTCASDPADPTDPNDDVIVCSTENWLEVRQKGTAPKFTNVSKKLLTLCWDTDGDTLCDTRMALFDLPLYDYFWNWNTQGKAHAQLFFVGLPD